MVQSKNRYLVSAVMKHGLGISSVWSSYFKILRQLGHNFRLWVYVKNNFDTGWQNFG